MAKEPLAFHCNFYNYWLQSTVLLDETLGMADVVQDAATEAAYSVLTSAAAELGVTTREERERLARDTFSVLGFGTADFSALGAAGGQVVVPVSHYGSALRQASGGDFSHPQTYFDAGYAAAVAAFLEGEPAATFAARIDACQSMGAAKGVITVAPRSTGKVFESPGLKTHTEAAPAEIFPSCVDEPGVLQALSGLDLSGNEEGLIPRFGVMLTNHFATFYNRMSFEFVQRMGGTGLLEAGESLLVDAGYRCAFHTFGGIMTSGEWDAVLRPQLKTASDWVHGMVAVVNALGWGVWRVAEFGDDRLVVRIWDDYESCGYVDMYGKSDRPVSHLAAAGVAGMMNLIFLGDIASKPTLDLEYYATVFERDGAFVAEQTKSLACGDEYTEIVATRG